TAESAHEAVPEPDSRPLRPGLPRCRPERLSQDAFSNTAENAVDRVTCVQRQGERGFGCLVEYLRRQRQINRLLELCMGRVAVAQAADDAGVECGVLSARNLRHCRLDGFPVDLGPSMLAG